MHFKASDVTSLVCFETFQILVWEIAIYYKKYYLAENLAALFFYLAEFRRPFSRISPRAVGTTAKDPKLSFRYPRVDLSI